MKLFLLSALLLSVWASADEMQQSSSVSEPAPAPRGLRTKMPTNPQQTSGSDATHTNCGTAHPDIPADDLWIRFNKISFPHHVPPEAQLSLPMLPEDYPICPATAEWLRKSFCWSIIMDSDLDVSLPTLINKIGGLPTHPSSNSSSPFWGEFREVIRAREARIRGDDPVLFLKRVPKVWKDLTLEGVAEAVHNEYPGKNQADLIFQFIGEGVQMDRTIVPSKDYVDFLRYEVTLAEINTWAIAMIGPYNFGFKWAGGRARPEEVAWYITNHTTIDMLNRGVPSDIVTDIKAMNLEHPFNFTAYPEGSPTHPSWPAMHSAASVVSFWLPLVTNMTHDQICEAKALDFGVSYGRTVAGVHYAKDNTAGLNLGQELLAEKLPAWLHHKFGSRIADVRAKINLLRHDWDKYLDGDCFNGVASA